MASPFMVPWNDTVTRSPFSAPSVFALNGLF